MVAPQVNGTTAGVVAPPPVPMAAAPLPPVGAKPLSGTTARVPASAIETGMLTGLATALRDGTVSQPTPAVDAYFKGIRKAAGITASDTAAVYEKMSEISAIVSANLVGQILRTVFPTPNTSPANVGGENLGIPQTPTPPTHPHDQTRPAHAAL